MRLSFPAALILVAVLISTAAATTRAQAPAKMLILFSHPRGPAKQTLVRGNASFVEGDTLDDRHSHGAHVAGTLSDAAFQSVPVGVNPGTIIDDSLTPTQLVGLLVGTGPAAPTISNVSFAGNEMGSGYFTGGLLSVGLESGVILGSGRVVDVVGPDTSDATTWDFGLPGDGDLNGLSPDSTTCDATVLEFDFVCPEGIGGADVVSFRYVFTSEEYNVWVNSPFNDVLGFFLNGTNIALLPDGVTAVSINNVNNGYSASGTLPGTNPSNPAYYINNDPSNLDRSIDIEANGLTVVLGAQASINPGIPNHMKLAIADGGDHFLDSWVFIEKGSFLCQPLNQPPSADTGDPYSGDEGSPIPLYRNRSFDPDGDPLSYVWTVDSPLCAFDNETSSTPNLTCTGHGKFTVTLMVDDGQATDSDTATVTVNNVAPTVSIDSVAPTLVAVGEDVLASGSFTDPGTNDTHTAEWDWGDGTTVGTVGGLSVGPDSYAYSAPGSYAIQLKVTDDGDSGSDLYRYVVVYDPSTDFVTGSGWIDSPAGAYYPFSYYELVEAQYIPWTDANAAAKQATMGGCESAHLVTITSQEEQDALYGQFRAGLQGKWYGGLQDEGSADPSAGWNWATGELWYYTNWAEGEPNDFFGPGSEAHLIGWLGGRVWNDEQNLRNVTGYVVEYEGCGPTGKATFSFVSKYNNGGTVPEGNTEFQFNAADLNFHSSSYDWLVVTGSNYARFKGVGTINGIGEYKLMLWAGDNEPDTFRIKIWEEDELGAEVVIYDNGSDQEIAGGSIVIHTRK